jgi:hypothetical protein
MRELLPTFRSDGVTTRWVSAIEVDGKVVFRIGRAEKKLVAEWVGLAELVSDRAGENVVFHAMPDAEPRLVAKVEAGLAAALVRHLHGGTSLHASTIAIDGRAIAFLGRSGAGKSTIAASLARAPDVLFVSDDILRIHLGDAGAIAHPSETEHWLTAESANALGFVDVVDPAERGDARLRRIVDVVDPAERKAPRLAQRVAREPVPLTALIALAMDDACVGPSLVRLRGVAALGHVVACLVRFVLDEPEEQLRELAAIERLLGATPLYELRYPRTYATLPEVAATIRAIHTGDTR